MNLMFWKKKPVAEADNDKTMAVGTEDTPTESPDRPGPMARLRNALSTLRRRRAGATGEVEITGTQEAVAQDGSAARPRNLKKRLIIGGALGAVILLLAGLGFAAWKFLFSSPEAEPPRPAETAVPVSEPPARPAQAEDETQAQLEALKKQNEEMARQLEALKNEKAQEAKDRMANAEARPEIAPAPQQTGSPSRDGNEVTIFTGKDPKAGAQALRQAIEEMNAAPGGGKPRKPAE